MQSYRQPYGLYNKKSNEGFNLKTSDGTPQAVFSVNEEVTKEKKNVSQSFLQSN